MIGRPGVGMLSFFALAMACGEDLGEALDDVLAEGELGWELFTPDFDYEKEPYEVRTHSGGEIVRCYPNGGIMNSMDGSGRRFHACECEVRLVGWRRFHEDRVTIEPEAPPPPTRAERQAAAKERRKDRIEKRKHPPVTWWVRGEK